MSQQNWQGGGERALGWRLEVPASGAHSGSSAQTLHLVVAGSLVPSTVSTIFQGCKPIAVDHTHTHTHTHAHMHTHACTHTHTYVSVNLIVIVVLSSPNSSGQLAAAWRSWDELVLQLGLTAVRWWNSLSFLSLLVLVSSAD